MNRALPSPGKNAFVSAASFRSKWTRCWQAYDDALRHCRKKAGLRRVHALRIASRQLLALLAVLAEDSDGSDGQFRATLEKVLRKSTRLRDLQVELQIFSDLPTGEKHRTRSLHRLEAKVRKRARKFARRVRDGLGTHPDPAQWIECHPLPAPEARFHAVLARLMKRSRESVRAQFAHAKSSGPRGRHRIRLALKAHRYLCEAVLRPKVLAPELARLRAAQSAMGDRRDFERLVRRLRRWGRSDPTIDRLARRNAAAWSRKEASLVAAERQARGRLPDLSSRGARVSRKTKLTQATG